MKIVFIGGINVPCQGGIENYVYNLATHTREKGINPWIICRGNEDAHYQANGVEISKLRIRNNSFSILMHNVKASLMVLRSKEKIDVVNYQSIYLPFIYEWLPKLKGIKVVHTQHSFAQDNPKHGSLSRFIISIVYFVSSLIFSPIITVSEHNKRLIKKRLRKDSTVINCGVNLPDNFENTDILAKYDIKPGKYYFTIGRLDPVKNLDVLIKAFRKHNCEKDVQLVISGGLNNNHAEYLKSLAGDDDRIIFTGPVYENDKAMLINNCKAFCLVSKSEGFPVALLEAMSHGCLCVCSDIPANREVIDSANALWVTPGDDASLFDCMTKLENDENGFLKYGESVQNRVKAHLTWDKIADQYLDYIREGIVK